jgi:hypothetical protein
MLLVEWVLLLAVAFAQGATNTGSQESGLYHAVFRNDESGKYELRATRSTAGSVAWGYLEDAIGVSLLQHTDKNELNFIARFI